MSQALNTHTLSADAIAALDAGDPSKLLELHRATFGGFTMELDPAAPADPADPADPPADPADPTDPPADPEDDPNDDSEDARVKRANRQAANYRNQLRETQTELQAIKDAQAASDQVLQALRKALTGESSEDENADPAQLLQAATGEVENLRGQVSQLQGHLLVHELAGEAGGNPNALLDSRSFTDKLARLDPSADDYRTKVAEAIKTAVDSNTSLRAVQGTGRGGAADAGQGAGGDGTITKAQFDAMDYQARAELYQSNPSLYRKLAG